LAPTARATAAPEALKKKPVHALAAVEEKSTIPLTAETLRQVWEVVLGQVGRMLASDLEKAGLPAISAPNTLVLRFPVSYNSAREHCQQLANVARVEDMLKITTGLGCHLRIETACGDDSAFSQPRTAEPAENSHSRYRRLRLEAVKEPLVKRAMELMGAQLVHVDDGFGDALAVAQDRVDVSDGEET
jgi:DNA polymerase-3 subunit gamma/tau